MKRSNYKNFALLLLITFAVTPVLAKNYVRTYTDKANVGPSDMIKIIGRHSKDFTITTTNESTVSYEVTVTLTIDDVDEPVANEILDEIKFEIKKSGNVKEMDLGSPFKSFSTSKDWFGQRTRMVFRTGKEIKYSGNVKFKLSVKAFIPKVNPLKLEAGHSNISLGHLEDSFNAKLSHCSLKANDVGALDINLSHSSVEIGNVNGHSKISLSHSNIDGLNIKDVKVSGSHSEISFVDAGKVDQSLSHSESDFRNVKQLNIKSAQHSESKFENTGDVSIGSSQHSVIEIENANTVEIRSSQHGRMNIRQMRSFELSSSSHTKYNLGKIQDHVSVNAQHTNMVIEDLQSGLTHANIKNRHASITLGTESIKNLEILANNAQFTSIKGNGNLEKKAAGYYIKGNNSDKSLEIKLDCAHCSINIR